MTPDERAAQWCGCGHRRTAHTFADLGECTGCPNGTCLSPFTEQLSWTDTDATDDNLIPSNLRSGKRSCLTCHRDRSAARRAA